MRLISQSYSQNQQFAADAAHELRTPLAAIQEIVELVLELLHLSSWLGHYHRLKPLYGSSQLD